MTRWLPIAVCSICTAAILGACVTLVVNTKPVEVPLSPDDKAEVGRKTTKGWQVATAAKAHMVDGSVILFPNGLTITDDSLQVDPHSVDSVIVVEGRQVRVKRYAVLPVVRYGLAGDTLALVESVPIDSVVALEAFNQTTYPVTSFILTVGATALATAASAAVAVAIFGSCPTIYTTDGDPAVLQAELFSNSISSLLELRDVDATSARADEDGFVELEIRNEALETHYINHFELLEVEHEEYEEVVPARQGRVWLMSDFLPATTAIDRAGRDVSTILAQSDSLWFSSSDSLIAAASDSFVTEHIDLTFPRPDSDHVAIAIRVRSSLLKTVLFYESILADQGPGAVDWLGQSMNQIGTAMKVGTWFADRLTLKIKVQTDDGFVQVGRVGSFGPIAWEDHGASFEVPDRDSVTVRLEFAADAVRIDRVRLAQQARETYGTPIPIAEVLNRDGVSSPEIREQLAAPDERYLITGPGTAITTRFKTDPNHAGARTFLIAAQGYYVEWLRRDWLRGGQTGLFDPSDEVLATSTKKWQAVKEEYESLFYNSRIPVR